MKIAVTGSDSFLAYHLIKLLTSKGNSVIGCDLRKSKNTEDLLKEEKNFKFQQCDITDPEEMKNALRGIDCIYHLAAISSERFCSQEPIKSFDVNVKGIVNTLVATKERKAAFVFSSSGSVYPPSEGPKKEEEAEFYGNFYSTSKLVAEKYAQTFSSKFDIPLAIVRFSRLYGPRMERNPIYDITKGLVKEEKILLYEGLDSNYDFIYVKDAARALLRALEDDKWKKEPLNISSSHGIKLKKLLKVYFKVAGKEVPIEVKRDISQTDILDSAKAAKLGFCPQTSLEEGLRETFLYFQKNLR